MPHIVDKNAAYILAAFDTCLTYKTSQTNTNPVSFDGLETEVVRMWMRFHCGTRLTQ